ncbi:MAG: hypothetical protein V1709_00835 [Planctomycetota bacterium]
MEGSEKGMKAETANSRLENNMELAKKAMKQIIEYVEKGFYGKVILNFRGGEIYQVDLERTVKIDKKND